MNKRRKGAAHEQAAKVYLEKRGVRIQTINYRVRQGEIDIVGYEKGTLVFFEVKYRANAGNGLPQEQSVWQSRGRSAGWHCFI